MRGIDDKIIAREGLGTELPWGTVVVNITGCFMIGFFNTLTGPDEDMTTFAMTAGLFPADMVQAGNTAYAIGPWSGSQVNVYSGSVWNSVTVAFWNIDQTTCNRLADAIATGSTFPAAGLVWEGVNNTDHRTLPPYGTDAPYSVSDIATACADTSAKMNVQVTYSLN